MGVCKKQGRATHCGGKFLRCSRSWKRGSERRGSSGGSTAALLRSVETLERIRMLLATVSCQSKFCTIFPLRVLNARHQRPLYRLLPVALNFSVAALSYTTSAEAINAYWPPTLNLPEFCLLRETTKLKPRL
jgi:hypothetical protein